MLSLLSALERKILFPVPAVPREWLREMAEQLGAEELTLTAADGVRLYGWRLRAAGERAVLFFSGNGSSVGGNPLLYQRLVSAGFDVLHVSYRGYPGSEGVPDEEGLRRDARAAWDAMAAEMPAERITLVGESLGGAVALGLAAEVGPRALVLLSTFESAVRLGAEAFPWLPVRAVMKNRFDSGALAGRVQCAVLIVHGTADSVVPAGHAQDLARRFPRPPALVLVPGADHNEDLLDQPAAWEAFREIALEPTGRQG
jgi:uncharacterized protein